LYSVNVTQKQNALIVFQTQVVYTVLHHRLAFVKITPPYVTLSSTLVMLQMVKLALHLVLILPVADNVLLVYMPLLDVYGVTTPIQLDILLVLQIPLALLLVNLSQMLTALLFVKLLLLLMPLILDLYVVFLLIL